MLRRNLPNPLSVCTIWNGLPIQSLARYDLKIVASQFRIHYSRYINIELFPKYCLLKICFEILHESLGDPQYDPVGNVLGHVLFPLPYERAIRSVFLGWLSQFLKLGICDCQQYLFCGVWWRNRYGRELGSLRRKLVRLEGLWSTKKYYKQAARNSCRKGEHAACNSRSHARCQCTPTTSARSSNRGRAAF